MPGRRVRLYISDIDGCLSAPFEPYDLDSLARLRRMVVTHRDDVTPRFTICSGRAFGYAEAMTQAVGFDTPVLFEGGGAIYDPPTYTIRWAPGITEEHLRQAGRLIRHWTDSYVHEPDVSVDFGKRTQASIIVRRPDRLEELLEATQELVRDQFPLLMVAHTHVSIDVFPSVLSKENGVVWLAGELGLDLDEIAYIGDSSGDIGAMERVGFGIAPANAAEAVRDAADYVCEGELIEGVLEGLRRCIAKNQAIASG